MRKQRGVKPTILPALFLIAIVCIAIVFVLTMRRGKGIKVMPHGPTPQTNSAVFPYTQEEMERFLKVYIQPPLNELRGRRYPIPEIQRRYDTLTLMIRARYRQDVLYRASRPYAQEGRSIGMGAAVEKGNPRVYFVMSALMDEYPKRKKQEGLSDEDLKLASIIGCMHELDHLAHGFIPQGSAENPPSREEMIDSEKRAWAETCEHTLGPLIEKYGRKVSHNELLIFQRWVASGRNANSPLWEQTIGKLVDYR